MKEKGKSNKAFNLKGGVLLIGSLLWQNHLDTNDDEIRRTWRGTHLLTGNKIMTSIPIRYGRYSDKGKIYTMTFSKTLNKGKFGTGYFVPFKKQSINTKTELLNEAIALSKAEGMKGNFSTNWGVISILINDSNIDNHLKSELNTLWKNKLFEEKIFDHLKYKVSESEEPCITANGHLNINWIKAVDSRQSDLLNTYDFILATATRQTDYPNIKKLSMNVKSDRTRHYFIENYKNGISTFQDIPVINSL